MLDFSFFLLFFLRIFPFEFHVVVSHVFGAVADVIESKTSTRNPSEGVSFNYSLIGSRNCQMNDTCKQSNRIDYIYFLFDGINIGVKTHLMLFSSRSEREMLVLAVT